MRCATPRTPGGSAPPVRVPGLAPVPCCQHGCSLRAARLRDGSVCGRADFGLSINEGKSVAKSMDVGTPGYCAPELLLRTHMVSSYDGKKADGAPRLPCPTYLTLNLISPMTGERHGTQHAPATIACVLADGVLPRRVWQDTKRRMDCSHASAVLHDGRAAPGCLAAAGQCSGAELVAPARRQPQRLTA